MKDPPTYQKKPDTGDDDPTPYRHLATHPQCAGDEVRRAQSQRARADRDRRHRRHRNRHRDDGDRAHPAILDVMGPCTTK